MITKLDCAIDSLESAIWGFGLNESTNHMRDVHNELQKILNLLQKYKEKKDEWKIFKMYVL